MADEWDDLLADEDDESLDEYTMLRAFGPIVQASEGLELSPDWMFALGLCRVARKTLQQHIFLDEARTPEREQLLLDALADVSEHEPLTRNNGFALPYVPSDWPKIQACLSRVLPLVERLLLH